MSRENTFKRYLLNVSQNRSVKEGADINQN